MRGRMLPLALALALACSGEAEDEYPSRDWGGRYATRTLDSSTDCTGLELPPPMTGFFVELDQHPNNRATVQMNPLVAFMGEFEGDHLEAEGRVAATVDIPAAMRQRADADSIDTTTYTFEADFTGVGFEGTYEIRTADIRALADGEGPVRCTHRYELRGRMLRSVVPDELERGDDLEPPERLMPGRRRGTGDGGRR